jgi:hypothetical protein
MDITSIKTGDIFYNHDIYPHQLRVLFVGSANLFYDAWWADLKQWTFVPVRKRLAYYRFPLTYLHQLVFDGFEAIDPKSADRLFLNLPEFLVTTTKNEIVQPSGEDVPLSIHSDTIAFIPIGPKGGILKPVLLDSKSLTQKGLLTAIGKHQSLDFIPMETIRVHRVGLHSGVPSYSILTY